MNKDLSRKFTVLSFITMVLVVILHANNLVINLNSGNILIQKGYNSFVQDFFTQGVSRVAVPIFFIISGYLFFINTNGELAVFIQKIQKRFKSLVIPYLIWSAWGILFYFLLQLLPMSEKFFTHGRIEDMAYGEILKTWLLHPLPYQLWFLRDLMALVLLSPALYYLIKYLKAYILLLAFIPWITGHYNPIVNSDSPFFFLLGAYLALYDKLQSLNLKSYAIYIFLVWIFLVLANTILLHYGINLYDTYFSVLNKTTILVGVAAVWAIYDKLNLRFGRLNSVLGYSFFLYAFHEPVLTMIKKGLFYIIGRSEHVSFLVYILSPIMTIAVSLIVGYVFKKTIPKIYSLANGGR
jgi:surface polysaccharide O-acyltransferase-like enzyme